MAGRLAPGRPRPYCRALEVVIAQAVPLPIRTKPACVLFSMRRAGYAFSLNGPSELYRRIDVRFDAMIAAGALEEVRTLHLRQLDAQLPAMKAHGVPWICAICRAKWI